MQLVALVVACLASGAYARRVKAQSQSMEMQAQLQKEHWDSQKQSLDEFKFTHSDRRVGVPNILRSFVSFLLACDPTVAFNPSSPRNCASPGKTSAGYRSLTSRMQNQRGTESLSRSQPTSTMFDASKGSQEAKVSAEEANGEEVNGEGTEGLAAAGALASSAVIAEAIQIAGTAVMFYFIQQWTGTGSPVEAVAAGINYIKDLGLEGYGVFGAAMVFLQVVPIAAAFVLTVSAGACFGAVKGTATVLTCSTISATISFLLARNFGRAGLLESFKESKQFIAIDRAFNSASFSTSLTLITLLRLSPVLPFAWANYVFGLSPVPAAAFSIGTFVGCLPAVTAYVSAGQVGAEVAINGVDTNPLLVALGAAATIGAITLAGNVATKALKDMDLDLGE